MPEAKDKFSETYARRFLDDWILIHSFRRIAFAGVPYAREAISADSIVERFLQSPQSTQILGDLDSAARAKTLATMAKSMTEAAIANARASIDAASIIFAHSILDGAASECCQVTALLAPLDWEQSVADKRVRLADVKSTSYEDLVKANLEPLIAELERKSLLQKIDLLFQRCQPPDKWAPMGEYKFDRDRIVAFDELRHDIIHGAGPREIPGLDTELDYLSSTTLFMLLLVNYRYKIKIDISYLAGRAKPT